MLGFCKEIFSLFSKRHSIAFFKSNVGDRVLFPIDQSDVDQSGKDILLGQVDWLQANADYKIIIEASFREYVEKKSHNI